MPNPNKWYCMQDTEVFTSLQTMVQCILQSRKSEIHVSGQGNATTFCEKLPSLSSLLTSAAVDIEPPAKLLYSNVNNISVESWCSEPSEKKINPHSVDYDDWLNDIICVGTEKDELLSTYFI